MGGGRPHRRVAPAQRHLQLVHSDSQSGEFQVRELSDSERGESLAAWRAVFELMDRQESPAGQLGQIGRHFGAFGLLGPAVILASRAVTLLSQTAGATVSSVMDRLADSGAAPKEAQAAAELLAQLIAQTAGFEDELDLSSDRWLKYFMEVPRLVAVAAVEELSSLMEISLAEVFDLIVDQGTEVTPTPAESSAEVVDYLVSVGALVDAGHTLEVSVKQLQHWCDWLSEPVLVVMLIKLCQQKLASKQSPPDFGVSMEAMYGWRAVTGVLADLDGAEPDEGLVVDLFEQHTFDCLVHGSLWLLHRAWLTHSHGLLFADYLKMAA